MPVKLLLKEQITQKLKFAENVLIRPQTIQDEIVSSSEQTWRKLQWSRVKDLWCFYQLFRLSFWRHPFTAEEPLVMLCNDTFPYIYILDGLRVSTFSFHFWVNYSFKSGLFERQFQA